MPPLKIYGFQASPPVRGSLFTIQALGIEVEFKVMDTLSGDHLKPEYLAINPLHTVPALEDGDFSIWDSHVINAYLVDKYGKDDSLYPKDLQKRAVVNQRLYFDVGILFVRLRGVVFPLLRMGAKTLDAKAISELEDAYTSLETLLDGNTYIAGDQLTIADFSIVTTLTSANILAPIAENRFPKISAWLDRMKALPYYTSANQAGLDKFEALMKSRMAS